MLRAMIAKQNKQAKAYTWNTLSFSCLDHAIIVSLGSVYGFNGREHEPTNGRLRC